MIRLSVPKIPRSQAPNHPGKSPWTSLGQLWPWRWALAQAWPLRTQRTGRNCPRKSTRKWGVRHTFLVGGLEPMFYEFPYIGKNNPNWRTHIFQRGRYTTKQFCGNYPGIFWDCTSWKTSRNWIFMGIESNNWLVGSNIFCLQSDKRDDWLIWRIVLGWLKTTKYYILIIIYIYIVRYELFYFYSSSRSYSHSYTPTLSGVSMGYDEINGYYWDIVRYSGA